MTMKSSSSEQPSALDELSAELRPRIKQWQESLRSVGRNPTVLLGIILIMTIVAVALLAPLIAPPDPSARDPYRIPKDYILPPRAPGVDGYLFGSGDMGLDVFYGVVWGARTTIYTSLTVVLMATIIGLMLGSIAGFYGGG